jgi:hypothetical protein
MSSNFIERLERIEAKLDEVIAALHAYDDDLLTFEDEPKGGPCSKHDEASWDEERMDIIGQNGNEGLHYNSHHVSNEEADEDAATFNDYGMRVVDKDKSNNTQTNDVGEKKRNKRKYYKPKQSK